MGSETLYVIESMMLKRLFTLLLAASCCTCRAQERDNYAAFSVGVDVKNATIGSTPTNSRPALDYLVQASVVHENMELSLGYEAFAKLDFSKYSLNLAYHFPLYTYPFGYEVKTVFIPGIEPTFISRYRNWGGGLGHESDNKTYFSVGLNLALRWDFDDNWSVEYLFNALPRTDLKDKFPSESWYGKSKIGGNPVTGTNFLKVIYKVQL